MDILQYVFLILICFGAGFIQRVSGFGLSIFTMMFLPHMMFSNIDAVTNSTIFSCAMTILNAVKYRKNVNIRIVFPMVCAAVISIPVAVHFSSIIPGSIFKILLGAVLIILSIYFIFFNKNVKIKPTLLNGILSGTISGTLGGLFSTSGPPAVLYISCATTENIIYYASIQFYFCFTNIYTVLMRFANGLIKSDIWISAIIGIVGCFLGDFIGKFVFDKLDAKKLKLVIYFGMLISGIIMIL